MIEQEREKGREGVIEKEREGEGMIEKESRAEGGCSLNALFICPQNGDLFTSLMTARSGLAVPEHSHILTIRSVPK